MSTGAPFLSTFFASIRSVASACTLAGVGIYLHRRGFIRKNGTKTLAIISQQVTIPILLFTKVVYCNQNWRSVILLWFAFFSMCVCVCVLIQ